MYRTKSFDEFLSKELRKPKIGREYIIAAIEADKSLLDALVEVISIMGTKEFAKLTGIKPQNVSRFLSQDSIPKIETLNQMLAPFKLKAKLNVEKVA